MKSDGIGRTLRLWTLALCSALVLSGCLTAATPIQYKSSASPDQTCTLKVLATLAVIQFNDESVNWKADTFDSWASVQIPSGSNKFTINYKRNVDTGHHYRNAIVVRYDNFVAGHTYEMVAAEGAEAGGFSRLFTNTLQAMYDTVNTVLRIGVRDVTNGQDGPFTWLEPESYR